MPAIDRDRWIVLEPLLDQAFDLSPEKLAQWLDELSTRTPDVAAELRALLTGDASAERERFLERPLELTLEGLEVGAYTLERSLGHGGMGSVWLARRTDGRFEGKAAVKLLNLSLASPAGQARFRREGSLLARLAHPGIARLLDAGVSRSGQPYLVLEYVDGRPLDAYATEHMRSPEERIRLFLRVLDAVASAHASLVVHRDLKPSNILVTSDGNVKLLDFGIAKLLDDDASVTIEGARAFTPQFAAPEQVRGDAITTATDVYSLGVILYMLLSGRHPTAGESHNAAEVQRTLLEVEPRPLEPRDLGSVVGKALRKEPAERYQNVESFADDLTRYLRHEPVTVARDPILYRARKFVRRHGVGVAAGAATFVILVSATAFSLRQMREAQRQRDAAVTAGKRVQAQAEFASLLMSQVGDKPVTVREILDRSRAAIEHQYSGDPDFITSALLQLSSEYSELGDSEIRGQILARAESISVATRDSARLVEVRCDQGDNLRTEGRYDEADRVLQSADSMLRRFPDPNVEAECLLSRATLENEHGSVEKSAPAIHRAIAIRDSLSQTRDMFYVGLLTELARTLGRKDEQREANMLRRRVIALLDSTGRAETTTSAILRHNLGVSFDRLGQMVPAESTLADVIRRMRGSDPTGRLPNQALIHYAHTALYASDLDSARKYFAVLADQATEDHNSYWKGRALFGLAQAELGLRDMTGARAAIEGFRAVSGNPDLAHSDDQVMKVSTLDGLVALARGDTVRGHALVEKTLSDVGYFRGKRSYLLHSTLMLAARTSLALHHPDSALVFARDAWESAKRDSVSDLRNARVGETRLVVALAELQHGDSARARVDASAALAALRSGVGATHPLTREAEALVARLR